MGKPDRDEDRRLFVAITSN